VARSLSAWPDRALLTPALPAQWGELEDALSGTPGGFLVVPALSQALPVVAQWFQGQWSDLPAVLSEVPVNLLILSASKWNVPSICNASRHLFEHLKRIH
jgi:hypothetical protein